MRILFLTLDFPPIVGGVANYYYNFCKHLGVKNDIIILAPLATNRADSIYGDSELGSRVTVLRQQMLYSKIFPKWLKAIFCTFSILRNKHIDLVIVGQVLPLGYISLLSKFIFGVPYFVCTHGLDILTPQQNQFKFFWLKKILSLAKHVISNSDFVKKELIKIGVHTDKTTVIHPCLDVALVQRATIDAGHEVDILTQKYQLAGKKIILSVGRLVERKGFDVVINAMQHVWKTCPDVVYIIAGSGSHKLILQQLAQGVMSKHSDGRGRIIFTDYVSFQELYLYYAMCDIFIMVPKDIIYDREGFGLVYLEANYFEKPVIGSRSGGVPEAIEHEVSGLLVEPDNVQDTISALLRLLNDKDLRQKLGQQGKARALAQFQWSVEMRKLDISL